MRKNTGRCVFLGLAIAAGPLLGTGCYQLSSDCTLFACGSSTNSTSTDGGGGDGGSIPAGCIPSENVDPIDGTCGVFVSSSIGNDDSGKGTMAAPFATLSKAIEQATTKGKPVYACGEKFDTEVVAISAAVALYGALDCANNWKYDASKKTELAPSAEGIALSISKATTSVEVVDFAIASQDAQQPGASSIAVLVAQASASFTRCAVTPGLGKAGAPGAAQSQVVTPADANGKDGTDDASCDVSSVIAGGAGGTNLCDGTVTDGGKGGKGLPGSTGDNGSEGLPMMTPGNGGVGQTALRRAIPGEKARTATRSALRFPAPVLGASGTSPPLATRGRSRPLVVRGSPAKVVGEGARRARATHPRTTSPARALVVAARAAAAALRATPGNREAAASVSSRWART